MCETMIEDDGIEEYGQPTDDWMMEETRKEFIDFSNSPGSLLVLFIGKPTKGRSKYHKDQFWFDVEQVIDMKRGIVEQKVLSTSSNQLRKKLTSMLGKHPDLFDGKVPISITWEGAGMERKYYVGDLAYESTRELMLALGRS